jgi:peptide/nickel transport system substrate-binding protein
MSKPLAAPAFALLAASIALAVGAAAAKDDTARASEAADALKAERIAVDEFNDQVKDKVNGDGKPVRGGTVRIRIPTDPEGLNYYNNNDAPSRSVNRYIFEAFIDRDPENFERIPLLAKAWEIRDVVDLKDGTTLEGRVLSETAESISWGKGAGSFRVGRVDVKAHDAAKGTLELLDGRKLEGKVKEHEYTIEVEKKPTEVVAIKPGDVDAAKGGVRRNCIFVFEAREGVTWHDGVPFTIDDALFSMDIIKNPKVDCAPLRGYYNDIKKWEKVGKGAAKFTYARPYYRALSFCGGFPIYPRHRYDADRFKDDPNGLAELFNKHPDNLAPVGTGPFKFEKWEKGKSLSVVRSDKYWAQSAKLPYWKPEQPYLDRIEWVIINNKAASLKELQNGKIDVDFDIEQDTFVAPDTNTPEFKAKFVRARHLEAMITYIGWNCERPFFKDARVRKAMTLLIDRQKILDQMHYGLGVMISGAEFIYGPGYDRSIQPHPYDVKAAKKLLREAGWVDHDGDGVIDKDGVKFEFEYLIHNARDYHQKVADIVKANIEQAGIKVNIKKIDWQVFSDHARDHKFDAIRYAVGIPDPLEPDPYQHWHSSQAKERGDNIVSYLNPEVDRIIEEGRQTFDDDARWAMYKRFHRILHEEQPWTFLYCLYATYFYNARFRNVKLYKIGADPYNLAEWYIPKDLQ